MLSCPTLRGKKNSIKGKSTTFEYTIVNQAGVNLRVCRNTFLKVLNITKHRVIGVFNKFKKGSSHVPVETRGGNHKEAKFGPKREAVRSFICSLKACESHYSRGKSSRVYLPSELSISKLWKMFNEGKLESEMVTESLFRKVFCTSFNIGFSNPAVDECSTCIELQHRMSIEKGEAQKAELQFKMQLHKKQAQCFFEHLREKPPGCFLMSFDCQKNLVLPKVSDQIAYYSRQLYCYNLSVVKGLSTDSLNPKNVSIYSWTEDQAKKSSNEVASIVYNELRTVDLSGCTSVRLVADGCGGQNKNVNILSMCTKWLACDAPKTVMNVDIIYPVTGHSFLPSDRVFGLIERDLKNNKTIIYKEDYHAVFEKYGTLKLIERDWTPLDWKEKSKVCVKSASQLHFKISNCRRVMLRKTKSGKVVIRGEMAYNLQTGRERPIYKAGYGSEDINPPVIPTGVPLKAAKLQDVAKLLEKHFGKDWRSLKTLEWYSNLVDKVAPQNLDSHDEECECLEMPGEMDDGNIVVMSV